MIIIMFTTIYNRSKNEKPSDMKLQVYNYIPEKYSLKVKYPKSSEITKRMMPAPTKCIFLM